MNQIKRNPQGGVHAQVIGRGRVWVESINTMLGTALVRFDADTGMRSRVHKFNLAEIDFGFVGGNGWKVLA